MKKLIWKIVLPLTLILFSTITMWRYVLIVDGLDEILTGFPLPYICPGWHTSLSYQIFISEFLIDFSIYFAFSFLIVFIVNKFIWEIRTNRKIVIALYLISGFLIADPIFLLGLNDHIYKFKSDFDTKTLETGFKFRHSSVERPDLDKYVLSQQDYVKRLDYSWDSIIDKNKFQIKYVKQAENKYLGFSPTKRIEDVNFIDSVVVLREVESDRLFQIISDSLNFDNDKCGLERYFVNSGFIFSINDTLLGAMHMTYDLDCIEFTPDLNSSTSWTLSKKGKKEIKDLINSIVNAQHHKIPNWIEGTWHNSYESNTNNFEFWSFSNDSIFVTKGFLPNKSNRTCLNEKYSDYNIKMEASDSIFRLNFMKEKQSLNYEFRLQEISYSDKPVLTYSIEIDGEIKREHSTSCNLVLTK